MRQLWAAAPVARPRPDPKTGSFRWDALYDRNKTVVVQVAPAVRVALESILLEPGENVAGKLVAA